MSVCLSTFWLERGRGEGIEGRDKEQGAELERGRSGITGRKIIKQWD